MGLHERGDLLMEINIKNLPICFTKRNFSDKGSELYITLENTIEFLEQCYEIAYGDDAINKNYSPEEVLQRLQDFSDDALTYEEKYKYAKN
jgi:hypothetical protein